MNVLYRARHGEDWTGAEIVARHPAGFVLREIGRPLPGIWIATEDQVRCACHPRLSPAEVEIWQQQEGA